MNQNEPGIRSHPLEECFKRMTDEVYSPFNEWVTGVAFERRPSKAEMMVHYMVNGGKRRLRQTSQTY